MAHSMATSLRIVDTGAPVFDLFEAYLRGEFGEFPHAYNDVVLSKTCESFRMLRLAGRIQWEMQEPLVGWFITL